MFNFFSMADNHEERKVDQYNKGGLFIDTCSVNDGAHEYETAIEHPEYNDGKMVIVEAYDTRHDAQAGHSKWVKIMTSKDLPEYLEDCGNSVVSQFAEAVGSQTRFPRSRPA